MKKTIRIVSEGIGARTFVYDSEGNEIKGVFSVHVKMNAKEMNTATLEIWKPELDLHVPLDRVQIKVKRRNLWARLQHAARYVLGKYAPLES